MNGFNKSEIIRPEDFQKITEYRVHSPEFAEQVAQKRRRRDSFTTDGKINIVAADHPARGSLSVGNDMFAMADRHELLARLVSTLRCEKVDGVLASMDILEDLLILHGEMQNHGKGFLDHKLLITSLNRGGIPGSVWELNDPITASDSETCVRFGIDAAKMLLRVDMSSKDTLQTILACADGVRDMNRQNLPVFLEPLPVKRVENRYQVIKKADELIPLLTLTAALGNYSRNIWLKIPYVEEFSRVVGSGTLPIVILGGDRSGQREMIRSVEKAMESGHQVRGAMLGRNVLYPNEGTPVSVAETIGNIIHKN
ncbi:Cgl0159 family (beta/alpha)8-fold protein [Rhodohalobacter sp. 614A]|uniref:Cgl0159 family (beta/alpha)8-fold protein n=1 Tax=Rhodohalobacter sp. 614A TaxID=2908649 RepID=UPI001F41A8FA|nr:hypothetical protein [Rhodohalobacter sp. 614A]